MKPLEFDAGIDLFGDAPPEAVPAVQAAVEAIAGAKSVRVEWIGQCSPPFPPEMAQLESRRWFWIAEPGTSTEPTATEWAALRDRVRATVVAAVAAAKVG